MLDSTLRNFDIIVVEERSLFGEHLFSHSPVISLTSPTMHQRIHIQQNPRAMHTQRAIIIQDFLAHQPNLLICTQIQTKIFLPHNLRFRLIKINQYLRITSFKLIVMHCYQLRLVINLYSKWKILDNLRLFTLIHQYLDYFYFVFLWHWRN